MTITDNQNRSWSLELTIGTIKRIKDRTGVDLANILTEGAECRALIDLRQDFVKLIDIIYVAIQPQAEKANVTDEQFGESMTGDCANKAIAAFWKGLIDFFRSLGRQEVAVAAEKIEETVRLAVAQAANKIGEFSPHDALMHGTRSGD